MAALGDGFAFRVTTEELESKAGDASNKIKAMKQAFVDMQAAVDNMIQYWQGEASDLYHRAYADKEDQIQEMIQRLEEHPRDLLQMAGVYKETEQQNEEISAPLVDDVIS